MKGSRNNTTLSLSDYSQYRIGKAINLYYPPLLVSLGFLGNILSFLVYAQKKNRSKVSAIYLSTLALLDNVMLVVGLLQYWLLFNFYPTALTEEHCHGMFFVVNWIGNYSHWMVVFITMDRFLAVVFPLKRKSIVTKGKAQIIIISLGIACFLKNLHYIWTSDFTYNKKSGAAMCAFALVRKGPSRRNYQWFETVFSSILPFAIIIIANVIVIINLQRGNRMVDNKSRHGGGQENSKSTERSITIMLLIVSFVFVVMTCPILIHRLYFANVKLDLDMKLMATYHLGHHICHKLYYTNNGINFFLYSAFGKVFREDLYRLVRPKRSKSNSTVLSNATTSSSAKENDEAV